MGILDQIRAEVDRRTVRDWPVGPAAVPLGSKKWGHDDSRFSPEEYGDYIATSAQIYSVAQLRARMMSGLHLRPYRGDDAQKRLVRNTRTGRLLDAPNPFWTMQRLQRMDELCMCLWGESMWVLEPPSAGTPDGAIWWVKPSRMRPIPDERNYLAGWLYEPIDGGDKIPFRVDEVVWFRYPNPIDEFSALSPLAAARLAADTGAAMMRSNRQIFTNGLQIAGVVVPDTGRVQFNQEQAEDLERSLERRFGGVDKAHKWAVLRYEAQFRPMQVSQKDAEYIAGMQLTFREVCNAYGVPAPLLNDLEHATLANVSEFSRALWEFALVPDADFKAAEVKAQFLPRVADRSVDHVEFDYSKVAALQESRSEVWTRDAQAIDRGALTINEWRRTQGLPDVEWGNVWWAPINKASVDSEESAPNDNPDMPNDGTPAGGLVEDGPRSLQPVGGGTLATYRRLSDALVLNGHQ